MKYIFVCVVLACATVSQAQVPEGTGHSSNREIVNTVLSWQEKQVLAVADVMPADKYSFTPMRGEFKGVRTFAEQLRHLAVDNYLLGAGILGEKPPVEVGPGENGPADIRNKAEVIAFLRNSFAYMHRAAAAIDDDNEIVPTPGISPWPVGTATRLGIAIEDCVHTYDHYGQLIEYLRMNGIVPPGSRK